MGEMADYYREQEEDLFYKEDKGLPGETYLEYCVREWIRDRERAREEAEGVLRSMIRALGNGTYWVASNRGRVNVNKMTKCHALNVVVWLERRCKILHDFASIGNLDLHELDPEDWLNEQPLMKNLRTRAERKLVRIK